MIQRHKIDQEYWHTTLAPPLPEAWLWTLRSSRVGKEGRGSLVRFIPVPAIGVDVFVAVTSALAIVARKMAAADDLLFVTSASSGEGRRGVLLPLRLSLHSETTLREVFSSTAAALDEAFQHTTVDLDAAARRLREDENIDLYSAVSIAILRDDEPSPESLPAGLCFFVKNASAQVEIRAEFSEASAGAEGVSLFFDRAFSLLQRAPAELDKPIDSIELLPLQEKELLLKQGAGPAISDPRGVLELFGAAATKQANRVAAAGAGGSLTYRELDRASNGVAESLIANGVKSEEPVGIIFDRSPQAIAALLGVLKAGAYYVPLSADDPPKWAQKRWSELGARVIVTSAADESFARTIAPGAALIVSEKTSSSDRAPQILRRPTSLAYGMFTSGTTGDAKLVLIEDQGILRLAKGCCIWDFSEPGVWALTAPLEFDASTFEVWAPLLNGWTLYCLPKEMLLDAEEFEKLINLQNASGIWLTAPLFHQYVDLRPRLFSRLKVVIAGGAPLSARHVAKVCREYPALRVVNGYGPTENTTFSTADFLNGEDQEPVPIGRPIDASTAYVVDSRGSLQLTGAPGELWVGGAGVAREYFGRPELTQEKFGALEATGERIYRTGDRARWRYDGRLEISGRSDDQVKIRGHRLEPAGIEAMLRQQPSVREAAVLPIRRGDDYELYAFLVAPGIDEQTIAEVIAAELPQAFRPSRLVMLEKMPLTARGKIDRAALEANAQRPEIAARLKDPLAASIQELWTELLERAPASEREDFFAAGGHSMKALKLLAAMYTRFGVKIGIQAFFSAPTIEGLAQLVRQGERIARARIEPLPAGGSYALSVSQKRLFDLHQKNPGSNAFNIAQRWKWPEPVDDSALREALRALIDRHEALRTTFATTEAGPIQKIAAAPELAFETIDLRSVEGDLEKIAAAEGAKPFDLETDPVYRLVLIHSSAAEADLLWTMHHIISDGWSLEIITRELSELYRSRASGARLNLPALRVQFKDYVAWQNAVLADADRVAPAAAFWRNLLHPRPGRTALPMDGRLEKQEVGRPSSEYRAVFPAASVSNLKTLAKGCSTGLFTVMFAGFFKLLGEESGDSDIITGIPSANRFDEDLQDVVGFFVDSLLVRFKVDSSLPFAALVEQVRDRTAEALDRAYYPIELACATVDLTWEEILTTFFNMSTFGSANRTELEDLSSAHTPEIQASKLPLVFYLSEWANGIELRAHYYRELFTPKRVEGFVSHYFRILEEGAR